MTQGTKTHAFSPQNDPAEANHKRSNLEKRDRVENATPHHGLTPLAPHLSRTVDPSLPWARLSVSFGLKSVLRFVDPAVEEEFVRFAMLERSRSPLLYIGVAVLFVAWAVLSAALTAPQFSVTVIALLGLFVP